VPQHRRKFSPEFREEAVKMVLDPPRPIAQVARELGLNEGTLGNWVNTWKKDHPDNEEALTLPERARLRELERENRDLRMQNEFLKKAAAFFASRQP
jgi:transposase